MPSSPDYQRDYKQEAKTATKRGENVRNAERHKARRLLQKKGLVHPFDGKDVDHIKPLSKGGAPTSRKNLRVESAHKNRSYARTSKGAIKP
jgi:hypothetical protein